MAQKTVVSLVDDLNGEEASETVEFGLDGVAYEIDLDDTNAKGLRESLAEYVAHARRAGRTTRRRSAPSPTRPAASTGGGRSSEERERNSRIREWARGEGMTVSDRGRMPGEVAEAYDKAHA